MAINKVPEGWAIVKITHDNKTAHDFMKAKDVERCTTIYARSGITVELIHSEGEEYDSSLVGEKDPEQLRRIGSVKVTSLNAAKSCCQ